MDRLVYTLSFCATGALLIGVLAASAVTAPLETCAGDVKRGTAGMLDAVKAWCFPPHAGRKDL